MSFDYFEDLEDFDLYFPAGADADGVHRQMVEIFGQFEALDVDFPAAAPDGPPHVLIGWRYDADLSLSALRGAGGQAPAAAARGLRAGDLLGVRVSRDVAGQTTRPGPFSARTTR